MTTTSIYFLVTLDVLDPSGTGLGMIVAGRVTTVHSTPVYTPLRLQHAY